MEKNTEITASQPSKKFNFIKSAIPMLITYGLVCGGLFAAQKNLIYYPRSDVLEDTLWETVKQDNHILGYYLQRPGNKVCVLYHGNYGSASMRSYYDTILPKDCSIFINEYPGYGSNYHEKIVREDILKYAGSVMEKFTKENKEITIIGESLGTGIASYIAGKYDAKKLVLITPYTQLRDVAKDRYWWLPIDILMRENYNSIDNLKKYQGSTLIVIADKDSVVPARLGEQLFTLITHNKTKINVRNAEHGEWWLLMHPTQRQQFLDYIEQ